MRSSASPGLSSPLQVILLSRSCCKRAVFLQEPVRNEPNILKNHWPETKIIGLQIMQRFSYKLFYIFEYW